MKSLLTAIIVLVNVQMCFARTWKARPRDELEHQLSPGPPAQTVQLWVAQPTTLTASFDLTAVCKPDDIEFDCPFLASVPRYCKDQRYWTWQHCAASCWCGAASATELRPPVAIKCRQRTNLGHCCFFPFIYNGVEYNSCITAGHGKPWCSLTVSFDVWRKWDECPET